MKTRWITASALALGSVPGPAWADQMSMPDMQMPMPAKKAAGRPLKKAAPSKHPAKPMAGPKTMDKAKPSPKRAEPPVPAAPMPMDQMKPGTMPSPESQPSSGAMSMPMPSETQPSSGPGPMPMPMDQGASGMHSTGALGPYPAPRESSGTSWQPDASAAMGGPTLMSGDWMLMAHGTLNLVYDHQSGPRGDDKAFASGMLMGMAQHPLGSGTVQFRAMLSPEPLMGPRGYPLLLASGETADGKTRLIDRQHPHDLFMELSASVSKDIDSKSSFFLYAGLPGEPAFGPPAFMHRESILDSPEAPITHHWLDSTHISFGVVTAGLVLDRFKIEASRFNAREPDQHRWDIETGPLDSTSLRISWNPTRTFALQGSWGYFKDPEQLEPGVDQTRWSASALWAEDVAPDWHAAATVAWGRKSSQGHNDDAAAAEASIRHAGWTVFGRGEWTENRELLGLADGPAFRVGKVSAGAVRDFRIADHLSLGAGGLLSVNFVPAGLAPLYGGSNPLGVMGLVRLKLN